MRTPRRLFNRRRTRLYPKPRARRKVAATLGRRTLGARTCLTTVSCSLLRRHSPQADTQLCTCDDIAEVFTFYLFTPYHPPSDMTSAEVMRGLRALSRTVAPRSGMASAAGKRVAARRSVCTDCRRSLRTAGRARVGLAGSRTGRPAPVRGYAQAAQERMWRGVECFKRWRTD